jgi:hypothetical protein
MRRKLNSVNKNRGAPILFHGKVWPVTKHPYVYVWGVVRCQDHHLGSDHIAETRTHNVIRDSFRTMMAWNSTSACKRWLATSPSIHDVIFRKVRLRKKIKG